MVPCRIFGDAEEGSAGASEQDEQAGQLVEGQRRLTKRTGQAGPEKC